MTETCAHCGQTCGDYAGGYGSVMFDDADPVPMCHPNDPSRPDCYRRATIWREPCGALIGVDPKPPGVTGIIGGRDILAELTQLGEELGPDVAAVCTAHMRHVPCRKQDGCVISEDPGDVARVSAFQRGN